MSSLVNVKADWAEYAAASAIEEIEKKISSKKELYIEDAMKLHKYLCVFGPKMNREEAIAYLNSRGWAHGWHWCAASCGASRGELSLLKNIVRMSAASADGMVALDDEAIYVIRKYI